VLPIGTGVVNFLTSSLGQIGGDHGMLDLRRWYGPISYFVVDSLVDRR